MPVGLILAAIGYLLVYAGIKNVRPDQLLAKTFGGRKDDPSPLAPTPSPPTAPVAMGGGTGASIGLFATPVPGGKVISGFGVPRDGGRRRHAGIDIGAPRGTPIYAAAEGIVTKAGGFGGNCGNQVSIGHPNGWRTIYCHLDRVTTFPNAVVKAGIQIGTVGNSGNAAATAPHLHFETREPKTDSAVDPATVTGGLG